MHIELLREHCVSKKAVTEEFPFDSDILVFKVAGKMFALISLKKPDSVNLKCNPEKAEELRQNYEAIIPGFHMSKTHWNTIAFNSDVDDILLLKMVDDSYNLVVAGMTKKMQAELKAM